MAACNLTLSPRTLDFRSEVYLKKGFILFLSAAAFSLPSLASTYSGSDTACFFGLAKSSCTLSSSKTTLGVSTNQSPLSYTPDSGFTAPIAGGIIDLGTFSVSKSLAGGEAGTFDIDVTFTAPAGAGGKTYSATTLGAVILGKGGVEISFDDPTTQLYTYPGGEFDLTLPSTTILIAAGKTDVLDGTITPLTVAAPEPAFLAAFGGMLILFALRIRHNRAKARHTNVA